MVARTYGIVFILLQCLCKISWQIYPMSSGSQQVSEQSGYAPKSSQAFSKTNSGYTVFSPEISKSGSASGLPGKDLLKDSLVQL